jgi:hypothetical protein
MQQMYILPTITIMVRNQKQILNHGILKDTILLHKMSQRNSIIPSEMQ